MLLTISYRRPSQVFIIIWYWKQKPYAQHISVQNLDWSIIKNKKIKNMSIISVDLKHWNITNVVEHLAAS